MAPAKEATTQQQKQAQYHLTATRTQDGDFTPLLHHDSEFSVASNYSDGVPDTLPLLNAWQGAALLTAECLGTGLLALPADIKELGTVLGLGFLVLNLPINYYAGYIFHKTALFVEERQAEENRVYSQSLEDVSSYQSIDGAGAGGQQRRQSSSLHHDTATYDFIGMTTALFREKTPTRIVMAIYYMNIFLVMGNYILVMSHAVSAVFDGMCLPLAGLIASMGMFVVSQSRTMARLGRTASIVSLGALLVVVMQCLWEVKQYHKNFPTLEPSIVPVTSVSWLRKVSATGSIGFAVGSQKLFLNIRHELHDRNDAPTSLGVSLTAFGTCYVLLCWAAGPNPPSFLFDAIPPHTWNRRIAGLLLWMHLVVSYALNSQAICSSMDRLVWSRWLPSWAPAARWMLLTALVTVLAYTVANAVPFFIDLVNLIGGITSVPLTLLLPALFWRKSIGVPLLVPTRDSLVSAALTYFAICFMVTATVGSLDSILKDWSTHGPPFSCT